MADLAKIILPSGDEYNFKDAHAREHIQDTNNPHQVTAEQAGAISKMPDYTITGVAGWRRFLTSQVTSSGSSRRIVLLITDTYTGKRTAIVTIYLNRTTTGSWNEPRCGIVAATEFTGEDFAYSIDTSTNTVSFYINKESNDSGRIAIQVLLSSTRNPNISINLLSAFENTIISELPSEAEYFQAMQDGSGNVIPDTYAMKAEAVPVTRTINGIALSADVDLTWIDVKSPVYDTFGPQEGVMARKAYSPGDCFVDEFFIPCVAIAPIAVGDNFQEGVNYKETNVAEQIAMRQPLIGAGAITLSLSWSGSGPYTQTVTVIGASVTENSIISFQPTLAQLAQLVADGVTVITIENNAGTLTAYALGAAPSTAMTIACTVTEVAT